jgi:hypothetical protein
VGGHEHGFGDAGGGAGHDGQGEEIHGRLPGPLELDVFPNQIRGSGLAVAGFFQWISNFAITMTFPIMLTTVGLAAAYGFYALCAAISVVFVMKLVHETKGKELEQMEG